MGLHASQADAMRRGMLVAAAISATLGAHAVIGGGRPGPPTLMLAAALVALAVRCPGGGTDWRRAGLLRLGLLTVLLQVGLHFGMVGAPWAFGLAVDAHDATSPQAGLVAHLAAALSLALLCWLGERLLNGLVEIARRVRNHLSDGLRGPAGSGWGYLPQLTWKPGRSALGEPISRGPPVFS